MQHHYKLSGMSCEKYSTTIEQTNHQYTCPMHPEIVQEHPGNCPICEMDLVTMANGSDEAEDQTYRDLRMKLWISILFTIPIFVLSMGEMLSGNPVGKIMLQSWSG